jgi:SAM-dependent methyltransferase
MTPMQERACFIDRAACISCRAVALDELSSGGFADEPLRGILASQAWGESPLPFIAHEHWCYVRCHACGQAYHRRILDPVWMTALYTRWETQQAMAAFIASHISPQDQLHRGAAFVAHALRLQRMSASRAGGRAPRVLDYGCGHGEFVAVCRVLGFDAVGIDFAPDREKHGMVSRYSTLEALRDERGDVPPFDAVTLFEVLEHLAEPRGTLEQLAQVMAPGAALVLETPDTTGVTGLQSESDYLAIGPLGHINGFTPATLRAIAERSGFRAVQPPPAWVAASWPQAAKTAAKRLLAPLLRPRTSQYFVRV